MSEKKLNGTVIVTYRCNARCTMCNRYKAPSKPEEEISIETIKKLPKMYFTNITGGEPLIQREAVYQLALELISDYDCEVSIETNGCVEIPPDLYYPSRLKFVMDIKCPTSGVSHKNIYENLMILRPRDEVKFVIGNRHDYDFMKQVLKTYPTPAKILVSPVFV